jgi:hypothetical protein
MAAPYNHRAALADTLKLIGLHSAAFLLWLGNIFAKLGRSAPLLFFATVPLVFEPALLKENKRRVDPRRRGPETLRYR